MPQAAILEIAGLKVNAPIDKAGIEQGCKKLEESGLFKAINFRYAPGPKRGYALTLQLEDQSPLATTFIEVPGVDEKEAWKWMEKKFKIFNGRIPQAGAAQEFLARALGEHLTAQLKGQKLAVRLETDLNTRRSVLSIQPELLPRIQAVSFTGNQALPAETLEKAMKKVVSDGEYTARRFASMVEMNLRPLYEEHGRYRVEFAPGGPEAAEPGVKLVVAIREGEAFQLGKVQVDGEDLPVKRMLEAGKFGHGDLANWKKIQEGIWEMEKVVKRTGYLKARSVAERSYNDAAKVLDVRVKVVKGPLHHWGELRLEGLSGEQEAMARKSWLPKGGDPYDYMYVYEYLAELRKSPAFRGFRKVKHASKEGAGDNVVDMTVSFATQ